MPRRPILIQVTVPLLLAACGGLSAPPAPSGSSAGPTAALEVVATIPIGSPPTLLAMAPDGAHLYAASNGSLEVIETASNTVVAKLSSNPNATGIAVVPNGSRVYASALFSINLMVLDTTTNTLAAPIQLFLQRLRGGFSRIALSPDGNTAYIANGANKALAIVSLPSGKGGTLMPDIRASDVALTPNARTLYVAGCKAICTPGVVKLLDIASKRFIREIQVGGSPYRVAVAPNGAHAYTANLTGPSVSVIDTSTAAVTTTVEVPVQPTGLTVSPDSRIIWVASQTGGALTAIDAATNGVRANLPIAAARETAVTPDGRRVYVSGERAVYVVDASAL